MLVVGQWKGGYPSPIQDGRARSLARGARHGRSGHQWPEGWQLENGGTGGRALVMEDDTSRAISVAAFEGFEAGICRF